jgi:uracil-DNA glycosylase
VTVATLTTPAGGLEPPRDCPLCPRLVEFRTANRAAFPDWHNAPVPAFGSLDSRYLFIGLAPGLRGANWSGRPFTGDYAGDLLYSTLKTFGLAQGEYGAKPDDGFTLVGARITNAVRCVPPENKPLPAEFNACRPFLLGEMAAMPNLRGLFAIGRNAHEAVLTVLSLRKSAYPFAHGAVHALPDGRMLVDSYHCSRYNTNTGRLTEAMFHQAVKTLLDLG